MRVQSPKLYSALVTLAGLLLIGCQRQDETARAQFVEVIAEINLTNYPPSKVGPPQLKFRAHCLIGSNCWIIQDNVARNATHTYWFTGTNIVACARITKEPIAQDKRDAEDWLSETVLGRKPPRRSGFRRPHLGKVITEVVPSTNGGPLRTMESLPWLAFCSGSFLQLPGRDIPLPLHAPEPREEGAFDKTSVFPDKRGLPSRVEFYTAEKRLRCTYEVQKLTNYLGSRLPLEFSVTHYSVHPAALGKPLKGAVGKVLSIATPERFEVPVEMSEALERVRR